ncbi:UNVERIFIED_CONTAM: hypothetical protein FKN15_030657 [Acipenser sinensis]
MGSTDTVECFIALGDVAMGSPDTVECLIALGDVAMGSTDTVECLIALGDVAMGSTDTVECLIALGDVAMGSTDTVECLIALGDVAMGSTDTVECLIALGDVAMGSTDTVECLIALGDVAMGSTDTVECLIALGDVAMGSTDTVECLIALGDVDDFIEAVKGCLGLCCAVQSAFLQGVTPPGPPSPPPAGLDQLPQGGTGGWPRTVRGRCCSLSSADPCGTGGAPLRRLSQLRVNAGPLDAFRRHSWEPGKEEQYCPHYEHHSVSLERLDPEGMDRVMGGPVPRGAGRDPRRNPIIHSSEMLDSLTSLTEESEDFLFLQDHADRLQAYSCSAPSLCVTMSDMERPDQDPDGEREGRGRETQKVLGCRVEGAGV